MKETKSSPLPIIPVSELKVGTYYFSDKNELMLIRKINEEDRVLHILNVTHHYNLHIGFDKHTLVKKVR